MDLMPATSSEDEAKVLFRKGVDYEREGFHYEATRCYKRALKLDPDVEKKIADEELVLRSMDTTADENNVSNDKSEDEYDNKEDLFLRFQRILGPLICLPARAQLTTHFSALPPELVIYIFRWVVSYDLDLRMLEQCAAVCRGWYLCARDPELWRRACSKFWPSNVNDLVAYDGSWRQMFIERPNVLTIGCYICKITYVRRGEESFRDNTNGPSFQVVYYRYLRFFSDGRVLMVLSYNPPYKIVRKLQTREKAPFNVSPGHYRLSGKQLFLTLDSEDKERDREFNRKYGWEDNTERKTTYNMVSFRSSPELNIDSLVYSCPELRSLQSPMLYDGVNTAVVAAASTVTRFPDFPVTAETKAVSLKSQRPPRVRSLIAALDLAGYRTISLAVGPPVRNENASSCPELKMQSPVYGRVQNTVPLAPAEILARSDKSQYTCSEGRCLVDTLDRRITAVGLPLRRSHGDSFRSSPEFTLDSPVYSRPELKSLQAPLLYNGVNTVQHEPAEMPQKPTRSERRKSAFTRSRRFIWKGLVNAARRLCFCSSFVDME